MSVPSGATLALNNPGGIANQQYAQFVMYGTYTAANFTIDASDGVPFAPSRIKVTNLTDRVSLDVYINSNLGTSNAEGLLVVAAGTATYEAHGMTISGRSITIDVTLASTTTVITADDDVIIELWR